MTEEGVKGKEYLKFDIGAHAAGAIAISFLESLEASGKWSAWDASAC